MRESRLMRIMLFADRETSICNNSTAHTHTHMHCGVKRSSKVTAIYSTAPLSAIHPETTATFCAATAGPDSVKVFADEFEGAAVQSRQD